MPALTTTPFTPPPLTHTRRAQVHPHDRRHRRRPLEPCCGATDRGPCQPLHQRHCGPRACSNSKCRWRHGQHPRRRAGSDPTRCDCHGWTSAALGVRHQSRQWQCRAPSGGLTTVHPTPCASGGGIVASAHHCFCASHSRCVNAGGVACEVYPTTVTPHCGWHHRQGSVHGQASAGCQVPNTAIVDQRKHAHTRACPHSTTSCSRPCAPGGSRVRGRLHHPSKH